MSGLEFAQLIEKFIYLKNTHGWSNQESQKIEKVAVTVLRIYLYSK